MRNSCNGCRVLRRGCGADCCIRPSIQWINSPESQAHATIFLAKFYGRAGLINLINAGPEHQRPDIFRSMLYEACGRIVDPVDGSAGLMWSGNWHLCQAAVDSVLQGVSITPTNSSPVATEEPTLAPPLQVYDIRHVSKSANDESGPSDNFNRAVKNRAQFEHKTRSGSFSTEPDSTGLERSNPTWCYPVEFPQTPSHENERVLSAESSHLSQAEAFGGAEVEENGLELELRLGFQPVCG